MIQQRIRGTEYSCFGIACEGQLRAQVSYKPVHRFKAGLSYYFRPLRHDKVVRFMEAFVDNLRITGQLAFDLIDSGDTPCLIECNPHTSNGVHLLAPEVDIAGYVLELGSLRVIAEGDTMIRGAMVAFGLPSAVSDGGARERWKDFPRAWDVIPAPGDWPVPGYQFLSAGEFIFRAIRHRSSFGHKMTDEVLWNGKHLD